MKEGQIVMVYEDPDTETKPEGKARLLEYSHERDGLEMWDVLFLNDPDDFAVSRYIKTEGNN